MLTIVISLLAGLVTGLLVHFTGLLHSPIASILPGLIVTLGVSVFLLRRTGGVIQKLVEDATNHMKGQRKEMALKTLREGLRYGRWNPLLAPQLHAQIGILLYAQNDLDESIVELEKSTKRIWEARAYLGCAYYKKKNDAAMQRAFGDATKIADKEALAYVVAAWCLMQRDLKAPALATLNEGIKKVTNADEKARLEGHIEAINSGKKMKVQVYGDRWSSFLLDGSVPGTQQLPKAMRGYAQRPGFRQKPLRPKK